MIYVKPFYWDMVYHSLLSSTKSVNNYFCCSLQVEMNRVLSTKRVYNRFSCSL